MKKSEIFTNGLIKNNPTFRLVLGTCPTLAVTTTALNSLGMGAAVTFVLTCSNIMISALRKVIPDKVRIPAFVLIIATFVTVIEMIMRKFIPDLYESLGLFLPLIVVNCIILARAEAFASTNTVLDSAVDGVGMGLGFTCSLTLIGIIREFLGAGSFFGLVIPGLSDISMAIFILPAGGFLVFGFMMALFNHIFNKVDEKRAKKAEEERKQKIADYIAAKQEAEEAKKQALIEAAKKKKAEKELAKKLAEEKAEKEKAETVKEGIEAKEVATEKASQEEVVEDKKEVINTENEVNDKQLQNTEKLQKEIPVIEKSCIDSEQQKVENNNSEPQEVVKED